MGVIDVYQASMADLDTVVDLQLALNLEMAPHAVICPEEVLQRDHLEDLVARYLPRSDFFVWLAEVEEQTAGFIAGALMEHPLPDEERPFAGISNLYVAPGFRRRRVGSALVTCMLAYFKAANATHVELHYMLGNEAAASFWAACGFQPESVKAVLPLPDSTLED